MKGHCAADDFTLHGSAEPEGVRGALTCTLHKQTIFVSSHHFLLVMVDPANIELANKHKDDGNGFLKAK